MSIGTCECTKQSKMPPNFLCHCHLSVPPVSKKQEHQPILQTSPKRKKKKVGTISPPHKPLQANLCVTLKLSCKKIVQPHASDRHKYKRARAPSSLESQRLFDQDHDRPKKELRDKAQIRLAQPNCPGPPINKTPGARDGSPMSRDPAVPLDRGDAFSNAASTSRRRKQKRQCVFLCFCEIFFSPRRE